MEKGSKNRDKPHIYDKEKHPYIDNSLYLMYANLVSYLVAPKQLQPHRLGQKRCYALPMMASLSI